jgi:hypothetical protein
LNNRKRNRCPDCLGHKTAQGSCQGSLERIRAMQFEIATKGDPLSVTVGNDWYINSADHNHCWWNFVKDLHGSPVSDKEICQLLLITPQQLADTYNSAISKLSNLQDKSVLMNMLELVEELSDVRNDDNTVYLPDSYQEQINAQIIKDAEETAPPPPGKPGRKKKADGDNDDSMGRVAKKQKKAFDPLGQAVHHSNARIDIQFASPKSYQTIADSRERLKSKKENIEAAKKRKQALKDDEGGNS